MGDAAPLAMWGAVRITVLGFGSAVGDVCVNRGAERTFAIVMTTCTTNEYREPGGAPRAVDELLDMA